MTAVLHDTIWLEGAHIICPETGLDEVADVFVADGKVEGVYNGKQTAERKAPEGTRAINVSGLNIFPGLVDGAVYMRSPGNEEEERLDETLQSAVSGGVTTVFGLPTTEPTVETGEDVSHRRWRAEKCNTADLMVVGALSIGRQGKALADMAEMAKAGAVAFSDVNVPLNELSCYLNACRYAAGVNTQVLGGQPIFGFGHEGVVAEGHVATRLGLKGIPEESEVLAVTRDVEMAKLTGVRMHLGFLSSKRALAIYQRARKEGLSVSAAVSPWHLMHTESVHLDRPYDTALKFSPPLRTEEDRLALCEAVGAGDLMIASAHRPVPPQEKEVEFALATPGAVALRTYFSLLFDQLRQGLLPGVTLNDLVRAASSLPASCMGVPDRGRLANGTRADLVLFCPETEWSPKTSAPQTSLNNAPELPSVCRGKVQATLTRGHWAFMDPSFEKRIR